MPRGRCMTDTPRARVRAAHVFLLALAVARAAAPPAHAALGPAQPKLLQKRYFQVTTGTSVSVTFRKPNAAGNLIVAYAVWDGAGAVSMTDAAGNAYASAIGPSQLAGDPSSAEIFYARNIAA